MTILEAQIDENTEKISQSAIEEMYDKYANMIYRIAVLRTKSRSDADDILQEVFLRVIKYNPCFKNEEHRKAWLIRVAINRSNSLMTSSWMRHIQPEELYDVRSTSGEPQGYDEAYQSVLELPLKLRTAIHLYYYEEYKVAEISQIMKANESTVKSWLYRAREILRKKLKEDIV